MFLLNVAVENLHAKMAKLFKPWILVLETDNTRYALMWLSGLVIITLMTEVMSNNSLVCVTVIPAVLHGLNLMPQLQQA